MVGGTKLVGGLLLLLPRSLGLGSPSSAESEGGAPAEDAEAALRALSDLERLLINATLSVRLLFTNVTIDSGDYCVG